MPVLLLTSCDSCYNNPYTGINVARCYDHRYNMGHAMTLGTLVNGGDPWDITYRCYCDHCESIRDRYHEAVCTCEYDGCICSHCSDNGMDHPDPCSCDECSCECTTYRVCNHCEVNGLEHPSRCECWNCQHGDYCECSECMPDDEDDEDYSDTAFSGHGIAKTMPKFIPLGKRSLFASLEQSITPRPAFTGQLSFSFIHSL